MMWTKTIFLISMFPLLGTEKGYADTFSCPVPPEFVPGHWGGKSWVAPATSMHPEMILNSPSPGLWIRSINDFKSLELSQQTDSDKWMIKCVYKVVISNGSNLDGETNFAALGDYTYCEKIQSSDLVECFYHNYNN